MQVPTAWVTNPNANNNARVFDSGSTKYDSGSLTFDGITSGQSQISNKITQVWANATNQSLGTSWLTNTAAYTNTDPYDTTGVYDTTGNYDAVVAGQSFISNKNNTSWTTV